ncbi:MAG: clostripain-related cysteine peptidase [Candidatus Kariarchaeaceae archaeon]
MAQKKLKILVYLLTFIFLSSIISTSSSTIHQQVEDDWTFLIFMDGDNNLQNAVFDDINEMEEIGSNDNLNIIVYYDIFSGPAAGLYIEADTEPQVVNSEELTLPTDLTGEVNMGHPDILSAFIDFGLTNYPASHTSLILWNHGGGWSNSGGDDFESPKAEERYKGISWDDTNGGDCLTQDEIQLALSGFYFDIIAIDACLMGLTEIAYDLKGYTDYVLFSEESIPFDGFPYNEFFGYLTANPSSSVEDVGIYFVNIYTNSYDGGTQGFEVYVTLSFIDTSYFDDLLIPTNAFANYLLSDISSFADLLTDAILDTEKYPIISQGDWVHFLDNLLYYSSDSTLNSLINDLRTAVTDIIVHSASGSGSPNSNGLAIYLPFYESMYSDEYETSLDWSTDSMWDELLFSFTTYQGNYLDDATAITVGSFTDTISQGDAYSYIFEASTSSPAQLYATLTFDDLNDFDLYIVNDLGFMLDSGASTVNNPEMAGSWAGSPKTFGIIIHAYEGSGSFTLDVVFEIAIIASEGLYTGNTADVVYYSIEVEAENGPALLDILLSFDSSAVDFDLYIYEGFDYIIASSEGYDDEEGILFWVPWTSTYVIAVYPWSGSGQYTLDIDIEPFDTITDGTTNGYLIQEEVNFYIYDVLSTTTPLRITFDLSFSSSVDFDLILMDSFGETIDTSDGTTDNEYLNEQFYGYGKIVVVVYSYSGSGEYTLTIESSIFIPGVTDPDDTDKESSDTVNFVSWLFTSQIMLGIVFWSRKRNK